MTAAIALRSVQRWSLRWGLALGTVIAAACPALSAETIVLRYGPLEFSLAVDSLATYAADGRIAADLNDFARYLNEAQLNNLRNALNARIDLEPLTLSQFLYSPQGEAALRQIGDLIQTEQGESGFYALRSALILAAADPETGLTALNVLEQFPVDGIVINSALAISVVNDISRTVKQTNQAIAAIRVRAAAEAEAPLALERDLRQPGNIAYERVTLELDDTARQRAFPVDLYLPAASNGRASLVTISHGLGGNRRTYGYLAAHLASHGFAVALPEHPGSNAEQLAALAGGLTQDVTPPRELIDRPLDMRFVLDELARDYGDRLDLERVAVIGQSFGAYTVLALAGAELDFQHMAAYCAGVNYTLNLSLLLQCAALELPPGDYELADSRVAAVLAINPLVGAILGPEQLARIQSPAVAIASGSADTVTPALDEQIRPFAALGTDRKYLLLLGGGTHFSTLGESEQDVPLPPAVVGPDPTIARDYMKAMSLALVEAELLGREASRAYLSAAYAQWLSQADMPLTLTRSLPPEVVELFE